MAKYFLTFVLLTFVALQNNSIYSRSHNWTQASDEADLAHYMRQQQQQHHLHNHHQHHHHKKQQHVAHAQDVAQHRHKRAHRHEHRDTQHVSRTSSGEEEERRATVPPQHTYAWLRHMAQQREHQRQQQLQYKRPQRSSYGYSSNNYRFGDMPRIWQHLQRIDERMYGDAPNNRVGEEEEYDDETNTSSEEEEESTANEFNFLQQQLPPLVVGGAGYGEADVDNSNSFEDNVIDYDANNNMLSNPPHNHHAQKSTSPELRCPKCESETQRKVEHISEEQLTRLRIEFVKQQILEKLRLKERPNVSAVGLPKPIYEGTTIDHDEDEQTKSKDMDDYYARTSKKFIFLEREYQECQRLGPHPAMCFSFKIDDADADGYDVNTAVLWIFKNKQIKKVLKDNTLLKQQTIIVSEVEQQLDSKYLPKVKPIAIQSIDVNGEWMKIDIEWPIKSWFGNHDLRHLIHISCQSCDISSMDEMISVDKDYRPFIMVDTQNRRRVARQKRSVNCTDGLTECCREKLYISFDEIGWGDWIIQPRGYDAYFCRGKCGTLASVTQSSSPHSSFLQKVISSSKANGKNLELIPCCTAKQYSSLKLVFMDSNNTATLKTFPNMVVESCGCR